MDRFNPRVNPYALYGDAREESRERFEEEHPSEEDQRSEWADKMMRSHDALFHDRRGEGRRERPA